VQCSAEPLLSTVCPFRPTPGAVSAVRLLGFLFAWRTWWSDGVEFTGFAAMFVLAQAPVLAPAPGAFLVSMPGINCLLQLQLLQSNS
jgi:hypothetical protein